MQGRVDDFVIRFVVAKDPRCIEGAAFVHDHTETSFSRSVQWNPILQRELSGKLIQKTDEFPGFVVNGIVAFFKVVQFFQYGNGYGHIMFIKLVDAMVVMQDNRSIQDEYLVGGREVFFPGHKDFS